MIDCFHDPTRRGLQAVAAFLAGCKLPRDLKVALEDLKASLDPSDGKMEISNGKMTKTMQFHTR